MKKNEVWISYIDDDDEIKKGFVELLHKGDGTISFLTSFDNEITIPTSRLIKLKVKRKEVEGDY